MRFMTSGGGEHSKSKSFRQRQIDYGAQHERPRLRHAPPNNTLAMGRLAKARFFSQRLLAPGSPIKPPKQWASTVGGEHMALHDSEINVAHSTLSQTQSKVVFLSLRIEAP